MLRTRQKQHRMNMLQAAGYLIRQRVVSFVTAVNNARFFSVLADETQDRAKR